MKIVCHYRNDPERGLFGGMADETLSARDWRWEQEGKRAWPRKLIDALCFLDPNHCEQSWRSEVLRLQLPKGYRNAST